MVGISNREFNIELVCKRGREKRERERGTAMAAASMSRLFVPRSGSSATGHSLRRLGAGRTDGWTAGSMRRQASGAAGARPKKTPVLEKPAKFNPPSHGARLPKKTNSPRVYGGEISGAAKAAQNARDYPGMMSPRGTWSYFFWHSRRLHMFITVVSLCSPLRGPTRADQTGDSGHAHRPCAVHVRRELQEQHRPTAHMVPSAADFAYHPLRSTRELLHVLRLTEIDRAAKVEEKRQRKIDDVAKRTMFRKAHGLETQGYGGLVHKPDEEGVGPTPPVRNPGYDSAAPEQTREKKRFMGLF